MMTASTLSRRSFALGMPFLLAACSNRAVVDPPEVHARPAKLVPPHLAALYGEVPEEKFPVPAVDLEEVDTDFLRSVVQYSTTEQPGTLIVSTPERALFLVMENGMAVRYGVGVGKEGLAWSGRAYIGRKAMWPRWTPTAAMIAREPERNARWAGGMDGGLDNPLGARALYLYRDNRDTMYRIHGTNEPWSIGKAVSSGCIRLINQDIIDLFNRVPVGTPVVVRQ
jgi:lipoprotein-anchoring transpeptidase ErfK/SrfK